MLIAVTGRPPTTVRWRRRMLAFRTLGLAAREYGLSMAVTVPPLCTRIRDTVAAWVFHGTEDETSGVWQRAVVRQPDSPIVYDNMYLADLTRWRTEYRRMLDGLRQQSVPVFNPMMPAKDKVYRWILKDPGVSKSLPRTWFDTTPEQVLALLRNREALWLKPVVGSGGRNMLFVRRMGSRRYKVMAERFYGQRICQWVDSAGLCRLIDEAGRRRRYMAQEHIHLWQLRDGSRVDFRVTVQRDETGQWTVTAITGRFGVPGSMLTNYHAGGRVQSFTQPRPETEAKLAEAGLGQEDLRAMSLLALRVARCLQRQHANLATLGIDIGGSAGGKRLYVYDCNSRPGRDILSDEELQTFMRSVAGFARYLQGTV